jgi:hypothetical protein
MEPTRGRWSAFHDENVMFVTMRQSRCVVVPMGVDANEQGPKSKQAKTEVDVSAQECQWAV